MVLKPAPDKLTQLNEDFPPWILRDLSKSAEAGGPRLLVTANATLLAVIHGSMWQKINGQVEPMAKVLSSARAIRKLTSSSLPPGFV